MKATLKAVCGMLESLGITSGITPRVLLSAAAGDVGATEVMWRTLRDVSLLAATGRLGVGHTAHQIGVDSMTEANVGCAGFVLCALAEWGCPFEVGSDASPQALVVTFGWVMALTECFGRRTRMERDSLCIEYGLGILPMRPDESAQIKFATSADGDGWIAELERRFASAGDKGDLRDVGRLIAAEIGRLSFMERDVAVLLDGYARCIHRTAKEAEREAISMTASSNPQMSLAEASLLRDTGAVDSALRCSAKVREAENEWRKIEAAFWEWMEAVASAVTLVAVSPLTQAAPSSTEAGAEERRSELLRCLEEVKERQQEDPAIVHIVHTKGSDAQAIREAERLEDEAVKVHSELTSAREQHERELNKIIAGVEGNGKVTIHRYR